MERLEKNHGRSGSAFSVWHLAALVCALAVPALFAADAHAVPRTGDRLPRTTVSDLEGASVFLPDSLKGKVTVIHFFATWCAYCPKEVAALKSIYERYGASGMVPCSVSVGESRERVASFGERERISYPLLLDPDSVVAKEYGVTGIPTTYVVDASGVVRFRIIGEITEEGLDRIVRTLLVSAGVRVGTKQEKEKRR